MDECDGKNAATSTFDTFMCSDHNYDLINNSGCGWGSRKLCSRSSRNFKLKLINDMARHIAKIRITTKKKLNNFLTCIMLYPAWCPRGIAPLLRCRPKRLVHLCGTRNTWANTVWALARMTPVWPSHSATEQTQRAVHADA